MNRFSFPMFAALLAGVADARADEPTLFKRDNLVAWCIVPFDGKNRGPAERAEMLKKLGFIKFAYDWRANHVPTFEEEILQCKKQGIEYFAFWGTHDKAFELFAKYDMHPQIWQTLASPTDATQDERVAAAVKQILPLVERTAKMKCKLGLYNHGGWGGEPENLVAVCKILRDKHKADHVGIVYNLHHGHDHINDFAKSLATMKPYLLCLNLNGMNTGGPKLLPLGAGEHDVNLLKIIRDSGYAGPIGIIGHTNDDVEERLRDNLDGLDWIVPQLDGKKPGPKPTSRTYKTSVAPTPGTAAGWLAAGKNEYRTPPLTVECVAKLTGKDQYNILIACDTKASAAHWELFTMPKSGRLTAYLPGCVPDHVRSAIDICDDKPHSVAMQLDANRVVLFVDGKEAAAESTKPAGKAAVQGDLAFGRLVEGTMGCAGQISKVRITAGIREVAKAADSLPVDDKTVGRWEFAKPGAEAEDTSKLKNPAKVSAIGTPNAQTIPDGPNLIAVDPKLKVTLIERSPDEAYMAVKVDGTGRVFVGGREKVFVFDPVGSGFKRRELLRLPPDSIVIGLEFRGDDLYVLASHGLYLVPQGRTKTTGLMPKRILWGVPLDHHVSFHCLAWGPEGDLYLNHGDPLLNYGDWQRPDHHGHWTLFAGPKGEKVAYTGRGAVLMVRPDGSNPRVVAGGLRGPVGLAFDRNWNLFTNDNDHESKPDQYVPAKLLHVTPQADFGWPRGWMARKSPDRSDLLDCIHGSLGRGVPCDLAVYDEPAINGIRGNLLMCRWDRFEVTRYPLKPNGATFTAEEFTFAKASNNLRPTGIAVDLNGRVFVTSLYLSGNVVTPKCPSDLSMISMADERETIAVFDETKADAATLWKTLSGDSWDARRRVHTELLRRGGDVLAEAIARLKDAKDSDVTAAHLPYLAAAAGGESALELLQKLASDATKPTLRLHALKALIAFPESNPDETICLALYDPSPAVQLAGLAWFLESKKRFDWVAVTSLAAGPDLVLRQTAATLMARGNWDYLVALAESKSPTRRLAAVLAIGTRLTLPLSNAPAPPGVKLNFPKDSAWFSSTLRFADSPEPVALASLGDVGSYTTAQKWNAVKPTLQEERLFQLLLKALADDAEPVRLQAAFYLGLLRDPRSEPAIAKVQFEARTRGLMELAPREVAKLWRIGPIVDAKPAGEHVIEKGAIDLTATHGNGNMKLGWFEATAEKGRFPAIGAGASFAFFRIQSRDRQTALLTISDEGLVHVWHNGRSVPVESNGLCALDLQPGGNDILIRGNGAEPLELALRTSKLASVELPEKSDGKLLAERLKAAKGIPIPPEFLTIDWAAERRQGDPAAGRKLFGTLGCAKCHAVTADQQGGGAPSLTDAGKRFTPAHIAESVLIPDRLVAEEFRTTSILTQDGRTLAGLLVRETPDELELVLPDTNRVVVKTANVEERKRIATSPMPSGLVKTPAELRDLIAYLLADRVLPP